MFPRRSGAVTETGSSSGIRLRLLVRKMEDLHLVSAVPRPQTRPRIHQGSCRADPPLPLLLLSEAEAELPVPINSIFMFSA